jgi:hypothetical protein
MSANSPAAFGIAGGSGAPLALAPPRGLGASLAALGPVAMALLRARRFLEALKGTPRKRPGGDGPREPPEDQPETDSIWDDPLLWMMLAMH